MVGKSYANELYVRKALDGLFYVGEISVGRVTKKLSVLMSGPIDVGDKIGGALILVNDYPNIVDYGQKSTYDSQVVFTSFLPPEGVFAAHKDKQLMGNASRRFPELYEKLAGVREHGGEVAYQLDGATYVVVP